MGDKSETHGNKIGFSSILDTFFPFPPNNVVLDCIDHSANTTLNWRAAGIRKLTLHVNAIKIEQVLKYRKASFPKIVSTTFVAHYLESLSGVTIN